MSGAKCLVLLVMALSALMVSSGCQDERISYPARQMPQGLHTDAAQISLGQTLFINKCASCHGKPSEGRSERAIFFDPPAPDFTEEHYLDIDPAYLFWRIEVGKTVEPFLSSGSVMPAWQGLSDREIWQLVAYLRVRAE